MIIQTAFDHESLFKNLGTNIVDKGALYSEQTRYGELSLVLTDTSGQNPITSRLHETK